MLLGIVVCAHAFLILFLLFKIESLIYKIEFLESDLLFSKNLQHVDHCNNVKDILKVRSDFYSKIASIETLLSIHSEDIRNLENKNEGH